MGKVINDSGSSWVGFIPPENVALRAALGVAGDDLHAWPMTEIWTRGGQELWDEGRTVGARIVGGTTYDLSIQYWGADGPTGAARIPVIIVSHSLPDDVPGAGVYHFDDNIEAALETAKKLAGDKDIDITGSDVAKQFLQRGYIDELTIHL